MVKQKKSIPIRSITPCDEPIPQKIREQKVQEVKFHISLLCPNNQQYTEIKRLFIILNLWEKFNRAHNEIIDLPFIKNKSIEVNLSNSSNLESKVVLKYNSIL